MFEALISILAVAAETPNACALRVSQVALAPSVEFAPYMVKARTPKQAIERLLRKWRADGREIGQFEYSWSTQMTMLEDGSVGGICGTIRYRISYPTFPQRLTCLSGLSDIVKTHEVRHMEITEATLHRAFAQALGLPGTAAQATLTTLDTDIDQANEAFHQTPQGAVIDLTAYLRRHCRRDR